MKRCAGTNSLGKPCRSKPLRGSKYCNRHVPQANILGGDKRKPKKKPPAPPQPKPAPPKAITPPVEFDPTLDRVRELAAKLLDSIDDETVVFTIVDITELFETLIGDPLTLDQTRAVLSYGINTARKLMQNARGDVWSWEPDWAARKALAGELRHLSKWDEVRPSDKPPENVTIVRMPCPMTGCPMHKETTG